jgi:hypothetical protein
VFNSSLILLDRRFTAAIAPKRNQSGDQRVLDQVLTGIVS